MLQDIRNMCSYNCPVIYPGNWKAEHARGWRWFKNFKTSEKGLLKQTVEYLQNTHGKEAVTVGVPMSDRTNAPIQNFYEVGVYIRDVEDLVDELNRALDRYGKR